jgi:predicted unusual protein kinase regulating ubiquinone biosynthesis (AarF/ABC1/UbiB family)
MAVLDRLARVASLGGLAGRTGGRAVRSTLRGWMGDARADDAKAALGAARDVARTLGRLRGGATKFGQALAIAAEHLDLPDDVRQALAAAHDQGEPVPFPRIRAAIERELGAPLEELFQAVSPDPIGVASLAQAHAARLPDGTPVVVKVLHDGVEEAVEADLLALRGLALAARASGRSAAEMDALIDEVRVRIREELDYLQEAANIEQFRRLYGDDPRVRVPRYHPSHSGARVLTLDHLPGVPLERFAADASPEARQRAGLTLAELFFEQAFRHRVLHADPHPGNYLFEPDGRVGLLDFGCVKRFDAFSIGAYAGIVHHAIRGDRAATLAACRDFGSWGGTDPAAADCLWDFCEAVAGPWRVGPYEVGGPHDRLADRVRPVGERMWRIEEIRTPPDVVFLHRTIAGVYGMGRRLRTRGDFAALALQLTGEAMAAARA